MYLLASYLIQADWYNTKKMDSQMLLKFESYIELWFFCGTQLAMFTNQLMDLNIFNKPATSLRNFLTEESLKKDVAFMSWQLFSLYIDLEFSY